MRRVLIITHERRGSTFLTSMLFGHPGEFAHHDRRFRLEDMEFPIWLNTDPPEQCKFYYHSDAKYRQIEDRIMGRPTVDTPEAYTWESPANLPKSFYDSLPGNDWRFIYLWRDPRNVISSLCTRAQLNGDALDLMFRTQCGYFQYELKSINAMINDPRFYLLKFEDFIAEPADVMVDMFRFMGFTVDRNFYQGVADQYTQEKYVNSCFQDNGQGSLRRWDSWSTEWRTIYNNEVRPGLEQLGVPEYLEW